MFSDGEASRRKHDLKKNTLCIVYSCHSFSKIVEPQRELDSRMCVFYTLCSVNLAFK